jgi:hypothetical protein
MTKTDNFSYLLKGIGVPLQLIDESITYGWTMK